MILDIFSLLGSAGPVCQVHQLSVPPAEMQVPVCQLSRGPPGAPMPDGFARQLSGGQPANAGEFMQTEK